MPKSNKDERKLVSAGKNFNKEIHTLRFSLTTKCSLDCLYCFVKKDEKVISFDCAKKILSLFLHSQGKEKTLFIYGGEPFLFFGLLKEIIIFSKKLAKENEKNLNISIGTNGTLFNEENLLFLRDNNAKIAVSLDGKKEIHNIARVTKNQVGSFDMVFEKIPLLFRNIRKENLCVLFGILPETVDRIFENFLYIVSLGFDSINIEPIQSSLFKWTKGQKECFNEEMRKVAEFVYKSIQNNNFIFLNSINRELKDENISHLYKKALCPFHQNLEVYPNGKMTFSPFFINSLDKKKFIIGDINKGFLDKYKKCYYDCQSVGCKKCFVLYNKKNDSKKSVADDVLKLRNIYSIYFARKILKISREQKNFYKYINEAKKRVFE